MKNETAIHKESNTDFIKKDSKYPNNRKGKRLESKDKKKQDKILIKSLN